MMKKIAVVICLLLLIQGCARADTASTRPAATPRVSTDTLAKPEDVAKITAVLGHHGVLFIRSETRWEEFKKLLPNRALETENPMLDFAKQNVVLVYDSASRPKDTFSLSGSDLGANPPQLNFFRRWDNGPEDIPEARSKKYILAIIPATSTVKVTFSSVPFSTDEFSIVSIVTWFSATLGGKDGGDIVDGLQATITPKAATIKPGEDILIDFELHLANMPDAHPQRFGTDPDIVHVWDGDFSKGYRNHGFFVTTPDGNTSILRPKELPFYFNSDHSEDVTANESYHLPYPGKGEALKSLKAHGLDTSTPGTYTITGLYEEAAVTKTTPDGKTTSLWGGSIASNTVTVEVKK